MLLVACLKAGSEHEAVEFVDCCLTCDGYTVHMTENFGTIFIILILITAGGAALYFGLKSLITQRSTQDLEKLVDEIFGKSAEKIAAQSREMLRADKELIKSDLDNKQKYLEKLFSQFKDDLIDRQRELRKLEQDRSEKFSELATSLENHRRLTDDLVVSTKRLAEILSHNQARGEWGERIIEDLLQSNGLIEGTHYYKQKQLANSTLRPDVSLLSPNKKIVAVDVKFPYAEIQKLAAAETKSARDIHLKQFKKDLKAKVEQVTKYIDPELDTMEYAVLFVPNEMVFSFINQKFPDVVDDAIGKRVMIVSPFTFLIVARTFWESYRNFMVGDTLREAIHHVDAFSGEWDKFVAKFEKYGRSISALQKDYDDLMGTRVRQMERKIENVRSYSSPLLEQKQTKELSD